MIIATAGHVDHGKTSLVRALTGVETDRLAEEKRRGLTIEPGFAYVDRDDGRWGFVDVPGHHRFVANMLTGAAGVDGALLVVAADDGPMPQTVEHLAILSLLGVNQIVVALSKADLVDTTQLELAREATREALEIASLQARAMVPVSATAGTGLDALRDALGTLAPRQRAADDPFRFAVDRAFSVRGAGAVVTGFVHAGSVAVGDTVHLLPEQRALRVRGIRALDVESDRGEAGQRLALNLSGIDAVDVPRGAWLNAEAASHCTQRFDARLTPLPGVRLRSGGEVVVHHGTRRTFGRLTALDDDADATTLRMHLSTREPLAAFHGDRLVLRDASGATTLAGGRVLDHAPPTRGRRSARRRAELDALEANDLAGVCAALSAAEPLDLDLDRYARLLGRPVDALAALLPDCRIDRRDGQVRARRHDAFDGLCSQIVANLAAFHAAQPQLAGMGPDELRAVLEPRPSIAVLDALLAAVLEQGLVARIGNRYRLPTHRAELQGEDARRWTRVRTHLAEDPLQPPVVHDLARTLDESPEDLGRFLARVHHTGEAVRVADNRFLLPDAVARLAAIAEQCAKDAQDERFTAREFKNAAGIGRNLAIDVLEYFDRAGLTRRRGNARLVARSAAELFGEAEAVDRTTAADAGAAGRTG